MSNIVLFKPDEKNSAFHNVKAYVAYYRSIISDNELIKDWNAISWGKTYRFTKFDFNDNRESDVPLSEDFMDFAKAYIKFSILYGKRKKHTKALRALKALEFVLLELLDNANINECNNLVLDRCANIIYEKYSKSVSADTCKELENIINFLKRNRMIDLPHFKWINPVRFKYRKSWEGYDKDLKGHSKLPDIESLMVIARIFAKKDEELSQRDMFTTSVVALLCCAPSRISEILALPSDCEISENDSRGIKRYGLRFFSGKGYAGDIKWIPTEMIPVAQTAVRRLRMLSKNARELALKMEGGYENFQSQILLSVIDENKYLTAKEVCEFLGFYREISNDYRRKIKGITLNGNVINHQDYSYTLNELKRLVFDSKPKDFPWFDREKNIKYSNALCLLNRFQLNEINDTYNLVFERPTYALFSTDLVKARESKNRFINIFERHGFVGDKTSGYRLNSHQPRHLLNTLALIAGMDGFDLARWSGRQCIAQNKYYDHRNHAHMLSLINGEELKDEYKKRSEAVIEDLNILNNGAVMVNKHGYCRHAYASEPCKHYPENESGIDEESFSSIHKRVREKANHDKEEGHESAQKWCEFHERIQIREV
ncbi:hypothetical protein CIL06_03925 [Pantoea vagans]|uniref:DNA-binding protein n=1 Tax=Pantoea vagans TaxID=470934 RepID=UPI000BAC8EC0|nr:DNA-binding protein [Pantoea vagans]PAW34903.1 hypothetical protein CIL06_03925 [Pantoea vagans]